jgi:hypothetical protein
MAKFEIEIDASLLVKMYKKGLEDAFILLKEDFPELDQQMNLNNIESGEKED